MTARRPVDVPTLVRDLIDHIELAPRNYLQVILSWGDLQGLSDEHVISLARALQASLRLSETFFVTEDMAALALAAASQLDCVQVADHDFVAPAGFLYLPGGWRLKEGSPTPGAISWFVHGTQVMLTAWKEPERVTERAAEHYGTAPHLIPEWHIKMTKSEDFRLSYQSEHANGLLAVVMSLCYLMRQKLAVVRQPLMSRTERRQAKRAEIDLSKVRVIELRSRDVISEGSASGREYSHRWVVRGHWRRQWYSADCVHRPIWIPAHIKGPAGKPLLGTDKVYSLQR
jgi:hypothetical protein